MFASHNRQGGRHGSARASADVAKGEAGEAFIALDATQKSVAMVIEAFARIDAGSEGGRLLADLAPVSAAADQASAAWINVLDEHAGVLDSHTADSRALNNAEQAFRAVKADLERARADLEEFGRRHAAVEHRVRDALAQVTPRLTAAQQRLEDARRAVTQARAAGIVSTDLTAKLAHAERLGEIASCGPHVLGARAALEAAGDLAAAADGVVRAAQQLTSLRTDTRRRIASSGTRLEGISVRLKQIPPTLSSLRRRFSAACSDDLDHIPASASQAVEVAETALAASKEHATAGRWEAAAAALNECRTQLAVAEQGVNAVVDRLRDLEAVAENPEQEMDRTRFAIRDAQRLVVSLGDRAPASEARVLDNLVGRLDAIESRLEGTHPDYWSYLTELRAVQALTADVVRRTRVASQSQR